MGGSTTNIMHFIEVVPHSLFPTRSLHLLKFNGAFQLTCAKNGTTIKELTDVIPFSHASYA